jgi:hypothetical protein
MGNRFASGKIAIAECDLCGFRFKLKDLKKLVVKTKLVNIKVCPQCWTPDQPQLQLGMYPVEDPQALREPRKDLSYYESGLNVAGYFSEGSRIFQWGWAPIGGSRGFDDPLTPNYLVATTYVGTVTITTS